MKQHYHYNELNKYIKHPLIKSKTMIKMLKKELMKLELYKYHRCVVQKFRKEFSDIN
jgi:hypothetical protein